MNFKKSFSFMICLMLWSAMTADAREPLVELAPSSVLEPLKTSAALSQYQKRPKTELSKLIFLIDRFRGTPSEVIYDGSHYDSELALKTAKSYMATHYKKKETAEAWIRKHAYRSAPARQIILYKESNGASRPLRDVLLDELTELGKVEW